MAKMPVIGEVVDDVFRVESEIDSGSFGSIYKVHDLLEDRVLALKVLRPGQHDEEELRKRFEREARLIYSLDHHHVVKVHYYGQTTSGLPYMAMEYLQGTDLRTLLHHHGTLNPKLIKRITLETLAALESAHKMGIIHRDLKPANIFLVNDNNKGHVKVLDFGFAKALEDDDKQGEITNAGTLVGTPAYMSPEMVHKKNIGPWSDLYAMGLIMAEMILGDKIIKIESVYDTILFQASGKAIKFSRDVTSHDLYPVVEKACSKSVKGRYATADEMARALFEVLGEEYQPLLPARETVRVTSGGRARELLYVADDSGDNDRTIPRTDGMPTLEEIERELGHISGGYDLDKEPTNNSKGARPQDSDAMPSLPASPKVSTPQTPLPERRRQDSGLEINPRRQLRETLDISVPPSYVEQDSRGMFEVIVALVLAGVTLVVIYFVMFA